MTVPAPRPTPLDMPRQRTELDLAQLRQVGTALHRALEEAVIRLWVEGGSYADIGRALGITRQSARERFARVVKQVHRVELRVDLVDGKRVASAWPVDVGGRRLLARPLSRVGGTVALWQAREEVTQALTAAASESVQMASGVPAG